jgi:thioredoxin-related protein
MTASLAPASRFFALALLTALGSHPALARGAFKWETSLMEAQAVSKKTSRPVLIYFTTDWCGYCKVMEKETFTQEAVQKQASKYVAVKLDAEKAGKAAAAKYSVSSYPTFVMLDPSGKEMGRVNGYKAASDYMTRIDQILAGKAELGRLADKIKANPGDGGARLQLALLMLGEGDIELAAKEFESAKAAGYKGPLLAKTYLEFGKLYVKSNFKVASEYLEAAIGLNEKTTQSEAYENWMMSSLYGGQGNASLKIAGLMASDPLVTKETAAKGRSYLRHHELSLKTETPDALVTHLVSQLQGVSGERDRFDFEGLFLDEAYTKILMVSGQLGVLHVAADKKTWHDALGYDKHKARLLETARSIDVQTNAANCWVECDTSLTLPDGKELRGRAHITITLMKSGNRWMIATLLHQSLPAKEAS